MSEEARMRLKTETMFMGYSGFFHSVPDHILLENTIHERMNSNEPFKPTRPGLSTQLITKSEKISVVCCIWGEKSLSNNDNSEALKSFTTGLRLAPTSSKVMAHCYYWRSIALQKLKAFSESLLDIERALELEISGEQRANLQSRRKVVQDLVMIESKKNVQNTRGKSDEILTLSYGENPEIVGVSTAIALNYNEKFGRHYVAARDIKMGDVLMVQKPFVLIPIEGSHDDLDSKKWICDYCLKFTLAPIPCNNCTKAFYCSNDCKSGAFKKYHKSECEVWNTEPLIGPQSALILRALIIATNHGEELEKVVNLMEEIKNNKDKKTAGFKDGKLDGNSINALLNLTSHSEKTGSRPGLALYSAILITALKKKTNFFKVNGDLISAGKLCSFLGGNCLMNLYTQKVPKPDLKFIFNTDPRADNWDDLFNSDIKGGFTIRRNNYKNGIAIAMYPVVNLLNHSCECNVFAYDDQQTNKIVRACKDIQKGAQIFISYHGFETLHSSTEERRLLMKPKFFTCKCEACVLNYTYKPELKGTLRVPGHLKKKLMKKPNDKESLWELLKLIYNKCKRPNLEAKEVQIALVNAYLGGKNQEQRKILQILGIL